MSSASSPLRLEKLFGAGLFLVIAALGWGPFLRAAFRAPHLEHAFLPISLAVGILALSLIYDAAERALAPGRGIYFAAVFCSLPATGILVSDPGLLPVAMLLLLICAAIWFAVRGNGENRRFFLAMLAGLLLISGLAFYLFPGSLAFLLPIWLAMESSAHRTRTGLLLLSSYAAGALLHVLGGSLLPALSVPTDGFGVMTTALLSPWRVYLLSVFAFLLFGRERVKPWHLIALITLAVTSFLAIISGTGFHAIAAVLAPVLALLAGDLVVESFAPDLPKPRRWILLLPLYAAAVVLTVYGAFTLDGRYEVPALGWVATGFALLLAVAILLAALSKQPRWAFPLMFASGIWFGSLFWPPAEFLPPDIVPQTSYSLWVMLLIVVAASAMLLYRLYYGRSIPKELLTDREYRFAGPEFRRFDDLSKWQGSPITVADQNEYHFIVFGDVTGAESPVTARRGGYFAFRALMQVMSTRKPLFALSSGDLSISASALPYRRVRRLLRHVPVPLSAIPGNHDIVHDAALDLRYFHSLFGADNHAFRFGPVQFVLLNNAWGSLKDEQFAWLEQALADDTASFLLVFCHKPIFDPRPGMSYVMECREHALRLHEMFIQRNVTAVFSGHIHSLLSENRDGVTYIVSGGAGSKLTNAEDEYHFLTVHISDDHLLVRALPLSGDRTALLELPFTPRSCSSAAAASRI